MKPSKRKLKKWRKGTPQKHRSYAEKRDRLLLRDKEEQFKEVKAEIIKWKNYKWILKKSIA